MTINKQNLEAHEEVTVLSPVKGKSGIGFSLLTAYGEVVVLAPNRKSLNAAFNKLKRRGGSDIDYGKVKEAVLVSKENVSFEGVK